MTKGRTVPGSATTTGGANNIPLKEAMDGEETNAKIVLAVFVVRDKHGTVMFSSDDVRTDSIRWNANVLTGKRDPSKPLVMESEFSLTNPTVQRVIEFSAGQHAMHQVVASGKAYRIPQAGGLHAGSDANDAGNVGRPMRVRRHNRG